MRDAARSTVRQELHAALGQLRLAITTRAATRNSKTAPPPPRESVVLPATTASSYPDVKQETTKLEDEDDRGFGFRWRNRLRRSFTRSSVGSKVMEAASAFANIFRASR